MPQKTDHSKTEHNASIKDYLKSQENKQGKSKTTDNKGTKQTTKPPANSKEIESSEKTHKPPNEKHTPQKDENPNTNLKRDASNRSPLEGNPLKKPKEINETKQNPTIDYNPPQLTSSIEEENQDTNHLPQQVTNNSNNPVLQELKEIKETLLNLNTKIETSHHELSNRMIDNQELKDLITSQNEKLTMLSTENMELKAHIAHLEKQVVETHEETLRLKVDFSGINEGTYETYEQLRSKIAEVMLSTCEGTNEEEKWKTSMSIPILDCQRLGQYNRNKKRPVRVTFLFMKHKNCLLTRKRDLPTGIYVDEAYPDLIKQKRASLRPILKYALKTEGYKGKCKMEHDRLIIKGIKYTTDTLHKLPEDIAPYKANQKSNHKCLIFHGQHTPLSNFHHSPFNIEGTKFTSSEQYIQYKKACHFHDYTTAEKIKQSNTPIDAKTLSRNIENYDREAWQTVCKDACSPGIRAKFNQNPLLHQFLLATKPLKLAECTYDKLWGNGLSLTDPGALDSSNWCGRNLLGEILSDIRDSTTA